MSTASPAPASQCEDKQRFATYAEADRQAWFALARRRHVDDDVMFAAYFCPRCSGWHIGNPRTQSAERWSASLA
ncbi:MAG TPA: hypothetical protein VHV76_14460 [Mycobacteriales bacterium]|nr:hypothetical protein [Mycobacteriales bacterium]